MSQYREIEDLMYDKIKEALEEGYTQPGHLKDLAEAAAWMRSPGQSHGGGVKPD